MIEEDNILMKLFKQKFDAFFAKGIDLSKRLEKSDQEKIIKEVIDYIICEVSELIKNDKDQNASDEEIAQGIEQLKIIIDDLVRQKIKEM